MTDSPALEVLRSAIGETKAARVLNALASAGIVCVPKNPTEAMIEAAWANALSENARGVWEDMVECATRTHSEIGDSP